MRPALASAPALLLAATLGACPHGPAAELAAPPEYEPVGQSKCNVRASPTRPLVVEWPAADRASLEARLVRGLVAVRAEDCEIEVLRRCSVPGSYSYRGLTRKDDQVLITSADDLYAQLPIGAARLEGKLARSGTLDVHMALVGMLEAPHEPITRDKLTGDCDGATHVIAGVQLGAFEFFAGGTGELGAAVDIGGAGVGGRNSASRELLSADGNPDRCDAATTTDTRPPEGCGAVLRIELTQIDVPAPPPAPTCPAGSRWDGLRCVITETFCPAGTQAQNGQCLAPVVATNCPEGQSLRAGLGCVATQTSQPAGDDDALCLEFCRIVFRCEEERRMGVPIPGAAPLTERMPGCQRRCLDTDAYLRWQVGSCLVRGCSGLDQCLRDKSAR